MNAPQTVESKVIVPNQADALVDWKETAYNFKKDKLGNKRPSVKGVLPVPSAEGFIAIIEAGGKQFALLQDACFDLVRGVLAEEVGNNENLVSLDAVDMAKYSWKFISEMDKTDRRSAQIPEELWKAFTEDYIRVMPSVTNKPVEAVTNATLVYIKKFAPWKSDKKTLGILKTQLAIYVEQPSAEEFAEILDLLVRRANTYLEASDLTQIAGNL